MNWKPLLAALDRGQRENDVPSLLDSQRQILAHLSLVNGISPASLFHDDASKTEIETVFAECSKLLAFKHPLVRKLAGWILLILSNNDNFENRELFLLAVNSLVASGTSHPDYLSRGKALTVAWQLDRGGSLSETRLGASDLKESAIKDCEYVRRLAVLFTDNALNDGSIERLVGLLDAESDPVVIINAFVVLAGIENGESRLKKEMFFSALTKLATFSESSKASFITILSELTDRSKIKWIDEDVVALLNLLDGCLDGGSAANLLVASGFLLRVIDPSSLDIKADLRSQLFRRILPSLWVQLEKGPEVTHEVLDFVLTEISRNPNLCEELTRDGIEWCHISPRDPVFLVLKKIEILVKLATTTTTSTTTKNSKGQQYSSLLHAILSQLFTWTTASHNSKIVEMSLVAVTRIRSLSMKTLLETSGRVDSESDVIESDRSSADVDVTDGCQAVFRRCMNHVIGLLDQPSPVIVASALNALKEALQDFDEFSIDVAEDASEDNTSLDIDEASLAASSQTETSYLHQLMSKIPGCVVVLQKAKLSLREKAISGVLFFLEKYAWALHPSASPAYILEDLYFKHFDKYNNNNNDKMSSKVKIELLSTSLKIFAKRPNETLPLLKEIISKFDRDPDMFLSLKSHKLFNLHDSF